MKKLLFETKIDGCPYPVELIQTGKVRKKHGLPEPEATFTVRYGYDRKTGLSHAEACSVLGSSIIHALECAGQIEGN